MPAWRFGNTAVESQPTFSTEWINTFVELLFNFHFTNDFFLGNYCNHFDFILSKFSLLLCFFLSNSGMDRIAGWSSVLPMDERVK